jgi:SagB-type dehydrogenase family enzyme
LTPNTYSLPRPRAKGDASLEQCLLERRSVRGYRAGALTVGEVGQLLWAAQGIAAEGYLRTAPLAGALYPVEVYVAVGRVDGIPPGVYRYRPDRHELVPVKAGDLRRELARAALDQDCIRYAPVTILFAAVYS